MRRAAASPGTALAERFLERREEIERALLTRVYAIAGPLREEPEYSAGLRLSVSVALEYSFAELGAGAEEPPVPIALLAQARLAARNRISLDIVLRRYFAGYAVICDFIVGEARAGTIPEAELHFLLRALAARFDRLIEAVTEEHGTEQRRREAAGPGQRARLIERLLAGEALPHTELQYPLEARHLGMIAQGPDAEQAIRSLAEPLDARLLCLKRPEGMLWAWLGSRRGLDPAELASCASQGLPEGTALGIGESAAGIAGWRFTHRQAKAALAVAQRSREPSARYADVALIAAVLQDELLATSLKELYLAPLERERDGGEVLKETLRAYFAAGRNVSSAAAGLGVIRHTVTNRLRGLEELFGRSLESCIADVEMALRLEEYGVDMENSLHHHPPDWSIKLRS